MSDGYSPNPTQSLVRAQPSIAQEQDRAPLAAGERKLVLQEKALLKELTGATDPAARKNIQERLLNLRCTMAAKSGAFTSEENAGKEERDVYQFCAIRDGFQSPAFSNNCNLFSDAGAIKTCGQMATRRESIQIAGSQIFIGGVILSTSIAFSVFSNLSLSLASAPMLIAGLSGGVLSNGIDRAISACTGKPLHEHMANGLFNVFEMVAPSVNERAAKLPPIPLPEFME